MRPSITSVFRHLAFSALLLIGTALSAQTVKLGLKASDTSIDVQVMPSADFDQLVSSMEVTVRYRTDAAITLDTAIYSEPGYLATMGSIAHSTVSSGGYTYVTYYTLGNDALSMAGLSWTGGVANPLFTISVTNSGSNAEAFELVGDTYEVNNNLEWSIYLNAVERTDGFFGVKNATASPNIYYGCIQQAINNANANDELDVPAGQYVESLYTDKAVDLRGANYGVDPNTGSRGAESILLPAVSDPDPTSVTGVTLFYVAGGINGLSLNGFTFDGDNTALTSGVSAGGADLDVVEAISAYDGVSNAHVSNNILKNISYCGIDLYNYSNSGAATSGNLVSHNLFTNIQPAPYGIGVLIYNNCYTSITDNVMHEVRLGVQTGNFYQADPGSSHSISNNAIRSTRLGLFHNLAYSSATSLNVSDNDFSTSVGSTNNIGMEFSSVQGTVSATISNNDVDGASIGINLWNCPSNTITVSGGSLSNCAIGVQADNYDGYDSNASSSAYTVNGVTITGGTTGIYVKDNALNTNGATVSVVASNNLISGTTDAIVVDGTDATGVFHQNSLGFSNKGINASTHGAGVIDATCNWFGSASNSAVLASVSGNVGVIPFDNNGVDASGAAGYQPAPSACSGVGPVVNTNTGESFFTIQAAINAPNTLNGHSITVADGTYIEDVTVTKSGLTITGESRDGTIVKGTYANTNGTATFYIHSAASGTTLRNLTVSRDYQNWYGSTKNYGVLLSGAVNSVTLDNIHVRDNRTGVYAENSAQLELENSIVDLNRTGIFLTNTVRGSIHNNIVTGNQTHGILYLADNPADLSALTVHDNSVSGNWYSEVDFKGTPALAAQANFECNWYGTATPTINGANTSEAGYDVLVPQQLGGTDPGLLNGQIRGERSADVDILPFDNVGTDISGDPGYQPTGACNGVGPVVNTNTGESFFTIQAAIDAPNTVNGHSITVADGTYIEDVTVTKSGLTITGESRDGTIVKGTYANTNGTATFYIHSAASGTTLRNLTVSRDYQNWYGSTKNYGVLLSGAVNSVTLDNIHVRDNRTGVYAENSAQLELENSIVDLNRTGIFLTNTVRGSIHNNIVTGNQTHGILYLADNPADLSALTVHDNNVSGNWYSEVDFKGTPALAAQANFECNWYGTATPTINGANTSEAGYDVLVPQQLGGTDPGLLNGQIRGERSADVDILPFDNVGTDISGDPGYQPTGACNGLGPVVNTNTGESFFTIQAAIDAPNTVNGHTITVAAGTYTENVTVSKSVSLVGPNAAVAGNGSRSAEAIITPSVSGASPYSGVHSTVVTVTAGDVSIKGFTIDGAAGLPGAVALTNCAFSTNAMTGIGSFNSASLTGTDVSVYGNIPTYAAITGLTVQNNIVQNAAFHGIDLGFASSGAASDNSTIDHNLVRNIGSYNDEGDGVRIYNNSYTNVSDNVLDNVRMGVELGNYWVANPGTTRSVHDNTVTARRRGIFYNLFYANASAIPVTSNAIGATADDVSFSASLWTGVYLISQGGTVTATIADNTIDATGSNYPTRAGYTVLATQATSASTISGGSASNVTYGVLVTNVGPNGFGDADADMSVTVSGVDLHAAARGVSIEKQSGNPFSVSATVTNCAIAGGIDGIYVNGTGSSATMHENSITGQSNKAINASGYPGATALSATCNWFGTADPSVVTTGIDGNVNYLPFDNNGVDASASTGYQPAPGACSGLGPVVNTNTGESFFTIQAAIDAPNTLNGHTITVAAGTYAENVIVSKQLTIQGQGAGSTIVVPAISNPNCGGAGGGSLCGGGSNVFLVQADNVTIQDLTVDGHNAAIAHSGEMSNGIAVDARNGIITDHTLGIFNNLVVHDVTVQNIYLRGIYVSSGGTFNLHHNTVTNVEGDAASIAMFNWVGSGTMAYNVVSQTGDAISANHSSGTEFHHNTITDCASGIHTDNAGDGGGTADNIHDNTVSAGQSNSYGIWAFASYLPVTIANNTVDGTLVALMQAGSSAPAGVVTFSGNEVSNSDYGFYQTTSLFGYGDVDATSIFTNNIIRDCTTGITLETHAPYTRTLTANQNSITGATTGAERVSTGTDVDDLFCNYWGTATVSGVTALQSGTSNYLPFDTNGVDTGMAAGYQPAPNSCSGCTDPYGSDYSAAANLDNGCTYCATTTTDNTTWSAPITVGSGISPEHMVVGQDCHVKVGLKAFKRFLGDVTPSGNNYTFDVGNSPTSASDATPAAGLAKWNYLMTIDLDTATFAHSGLQVFLDVDFNPATGTPTYYTANVGNALMAQNPAYGGLTKVDDTQNLGFPFWAAIGDPNIAPLPFDPFAAGEYDLNVRVVSPNGQLLAQAPIKVTVQEIPGCMNPLATNYNAEATVDNGTCTFCSPGSITYNTPIPTPIVIGSGIPADNAVVSTCGNFTVGLTAFNRYGSAIVPVNNNEYDAFVGESPTSGSNPAPAIGTARWNYLASVDLGSYDFTQVGVFLDMDRDPSSGAPSYNTVDVSAYMASQGLEHTHIAQSSENFGFAYWTAAPFNFPAFNPATEGQYDIRVRLVDPSNDSLLTTAMIKVVVDCPEITVTATPGTILCNGGSTSVDVSATGGVEPYTGTGTFTAQLAGDHTYTVTDHYGCAVPTMITIAEPTQVLVNASATSTTICAGSNIELHAAGSGGTAALHYAWSGPGFSSTDQDPVITGATTANAGDYTVTATDANNCSSTSSTVSIVVNTQPTFAGCPSNITVSTTGSCGQVVTWTAPTIQGMPTPAFSGDHTSGETFPIGTTTVTYTSANNGCGIAVCSFTVTVEDHQAPSITCHANVTTSTTFTACTQTVNGIAPTAVSDNCPSPAVTYALTGATTGSGSNDASGTLFNLGVTTVTYTATDASGNHSSCSFTVTVIDNVSPSVSCPLPVSVGTDPGQCTATLGAPIRPTIVDNCSPTFEIRYSQAGVAGPTSTLIGDLDALNAFTATFPKGNSTIWYWISDTHNNNSTCQVNVTVTDNQAPVVVCPGNVSTTVDHGFCYAVVNGIAPTVTENCTFTVGYTLSGATTGSGLNNASGQAFNPGTTTVTYTVTETTAPNTVVNCSFTVTVLDNEPPVIACPADIARNTDAGLCSASVTGGLTPTSSDACPGSALTYVISGASTGSGSAPLSSFTFAKGVSTVTWTATDAAHNVTNCSFTVTVTDAEQPSLTCPADIAVSTDPNACSAAISSGLGITFDDNCPGSTAAYTITGATTGSGSGALSAFTFVKGISTVTYTVTDAAGNTNSCQQHITVSDNQAPSIACGPVSTTLPATPNQCGTLASVSAPTYSDNCGADLTYVVKDANGVVLTSGTGALTDWFFPVGTSTVIYSVSDGVNTVQCTSSMIVIDNQTPQIQCPLNTALNTDPDQCYATATLAPVATSDNCVPLPADAVSYTLNNGSSVTGAISGVQFPKGMTHVVYTVTDAAHLSSTCAFDVTVTDAQPPVVNCPTVAPIGTDDGECFATVEWSTLQPTIAENCTYDLTYVMTGATSGSGTATGASTVLNRGVSHIVWTANDGSNAPVSCSMDVTIEDRELPTFTRPADITIFTDDACAYDASLAVTGDVTDEADNCSPVLQATSTDVLTNGPCQGSHVITRTWHLVDANGNAAADQVQTITVNDNTAPTFTAPADITIFTDAACAYDATVAATGDVTNEADNCSTGIQATFTDVIVDGTCEGSHVITRTWHLSDNCGNAAADQVQTITVNDNTAPTFTRPADITIFTDATCDYDATVAATGDVTNEADNCSTGIQATFTDVIVNGTCEGSHVITRTWHLSDNCGNAAADQVQTITVNDNTAPTFTRPADITIFTDATCDYDATVAATGDVTNEADNCSTGIQATFTDVIVDGHCEGSHVITRTWHLSDNCGNAAADQVQTITVNDNTAPTFTAPADITIFTDAACAYDATVAATGDVTNEADNCSTGIQATFTDVIVDGHCEGSHVITRTWHLSDNCGNAAADQVQTITVNDNTAPTFTAPADITIFTDAVCSYDATVAATGDVTNEADNCSTGIQATFTDVIVDGHCEGSHVITRTWHLSDNCGNAAADQVQTITVNDNTAPTFTAPADITIFTDAACDYDATVAATGDVTNEADNCSTGIQATFTDVIVNGTCEGSHVITRTWHLSDNCGNAAADQVQTITVNDNTAPTFTRPADITIFTDATCDYDATVAATGDVTNEADNCSTGIQATFTDVIVDGHCEGSHVITRTWHLSDNCGNAAADQVQTITVNDNTAPTFTAPADITIFTDAACDYDATVAATGDVTNEADNCSTGIQATFTDVIVNGTCEGSHVITRTWHLSDNCGNAAADQVQTITVNDNTAPTFTRPADITIFTDATCDYDATVAATGDVTDEADNCSTGIQATFTDVIVDGHCEGSHVITRTWHLSDNCGNAAADQVQTITVNDNTAPTFTAPADITIFTDAACDYDATVAATGDVTNEADNCSTGIQATFTDVIVNGTCEGSHVITRTWHLSDNCGNAAADQVQTITVNDNTAPTFTRPADITIFTDATCDYDATVAATGDVTNEADNCSTGIQATFTDVIVDGHCEGSHVITRTWHLSDNCGNAAADQVQTITVNDNTAPTFTAPADITIFTDAACAYDATVAATGDVTNEADNCSTGIQATFTDVIVDGHCEGSHVITRTWHLSDNCGNAAADQVQTITVNDNTAPTFTRPADITIFTDAACDYDATVAATGDVTNEADNCSTGIQATFTDVIVNGTCEGSHVITRTWHLSDNCGNAAADQVQTITVNDNTAPVITFIPANVTVSCAGEMPAVALGDVVAADNCSTPVISSADVISAQSCTNRYTVTRTYTATDACGNASSMAQTITVDDETAPVISSIPANVTVNCAGEVPAVNTAAVLATDNCTGTPVITANDVISAQTCVNRYTITRTYTATDACGNASMMDQVITVDDESAPVISSIPADVTVSCAGEVPASNTGAVVATDNCTGAPVITVATDVISAQTCDNRYTITRTYTATDACGNASSMAQMITVNDQTAPVISSIPANVTVSCAGEVPASNTGAVLATDNCTGAPVITVNDVISDQTCVNRYTISRTYTATDACGNASSMVQTIIVNDQTAPIITGTSIAAQYASLGAAEAAALAATSATDNCSGAPVMSVSTVGTCNATITVTATDACGNSAQTTYSTVIDGTLPTAICHSISVNLDASGNASITAAQVDNGSNDNCGTASLTVNPSTFTCANIGANTVTLTVNDGHGNTASCTSTVTVVDNTAPVVTTPAGSFDVTLQCNNTSGLLAALAQAPSATETCGTVASHLLSNVTTPDPGCANSYVQVRTWNFTDGHGNTSANFTQTITVIDTQAPVIANAPGSFDANLQCNNVSGLLAALAQQPTATDNCTASPTRNMTSDVTTPNPSCPNAYTRLRTWTFSDGCGNTSTFVQTIIVNDNSAPLVSTTAGSLNASLSCSDASGIAAAVAAEPNATDNCTASPARNLVSDNTVVGACPNSYVRTRVWNFSDGCGNTSANFTQVITVTDNTSPIATAGTIAAHYPTVAAAQAAALAATSATDNCTASGSLTFNATTTGSCSAVISVTASDGCGNTSTAVTYNTSIDVDSDGDGTFDCADGCPNDANKVAPGVCGCGVSDVDTDVDGVADCHDNCPTLAGQIGSPCDDGNPLTGNDLITASCVCAGQPFDCAGVPGGFALPGTACDDGNATTTSDTYNASCVCVGVVSPCGGNAVVVRIKLDGDGGGLTWNLSDGFLFTAHGGPYTGQGNVVLDTLVCLPSSFSQQYSFSLHDAFGDGLCCNSGQGYWELRTTTGQVLLRDIFDNTVNGHDSPSTTPQNPAYNDGHQFALPPGPAAIASTSCGVFNYTPESKVFCDAVPAATAYQFEFTNPDAGFLRRIAVPRNWVKFNEMVTTPLVPGVTYFVRARVDLGTGFVSAHTGPGCEVAMSASAGSTCTYLVNDPDLPTFSCGVTRSFGGSDKIWAKPVSGATLYRFRFTNTAQGFVRNISFPSYVCLLSWTNQPLVNGTTYDVQVETMVNNVLSGFCGSVCQVTIQPRATRPEARSLDIANDLTTNMWPNPVGDGRVNLVINSITEEEQRIGVDIFDLTGNKLFTKEYDNSGDTFNTVLELPKGTAPGIYLVNITMNGHTYTKRLSVM